MTQTQDVVRGTFSHRHVGLTDQKDERVYFPLNHIRPDQKGRLEAVNSPLSELAVMAFEYGHTLEGAYMSLLPGARAVCLTSRQIRGHW